MQAGRYGVQIFSPYYIRALELFLVLNLSPICIAARQLTVSNAMNWVCWNFLIISTFTVVKMIQTCAPELSLSRLLPACRPLRPRRLIFQRKLTQRMIYTG